MQDADVTETALDPSLEDRIRAMAKRWGFSEDEVQYSLDQARTKPDDWLRLVEFDERWCYAHPERVPNPDFVQEVKRAKT